MNVWQWLKQARCLFALYHQWDVQVSGNTITHTCKRLLSIDKAQLYEYHLNEGVFLLLLHRFPDHRRRSIFPFLWHHFMASLYASPI
jgi:hypothetical protein